MISKCFFILIACVLQGYCDSEKIKSNGVGAYAYQDSTGKRYGGTVDLKDGKVVKNGDEEIPPIIEDTFNNFFPQYFRNFEILLQQVFPFNYENQQLALNAAGKAYDLTASTDENNYELPYEPPTPQFLGFNPFQNLGPNSAFASAFIGPGYRHQVANIQPENPEMPNIDISSRSGSSQDDENPQYHSVHSSSSVVSSQNIDGKHKTVAMTVINDNGKITKYSASN